MLERLLLLGLLLALLFLCCSGTGQWKPGNRLLIMYSRFNALVLGLLLCCVVGSSLLASLPVVVLRFSLVLTRGGAPSLAMRVPARPAAVLSVLGGPSLSAAFVDRVLVAHHSPAAGTGWALYTLSVRYGIDDAVALAFFWHESTFGTRGEAVVTHSLGNLRCIAGAACIDQDRGGYAAFPDWPAGYAAWYALIAGPLYVGAGRTTVETIIPRYAPSRDGNDERAYAADVVWTVGQLRAGRLSW